MLLEPFPSVVRYLATVVVATTAADLRQGSTTKVALGRKEGERGGEIEGTHQVNRRTRRGAPEEYLCTKNVSLPPRLTRVMK